MKHGKKFTLIQADLSDLTMFAMESKQKKKINLWKLALAPCGNGHWRGDSASIIGENTICPDIAEKRRRYIEIDFWSKCKKLCVKQWAGRKWKCCGKNTFGRIGAGKVNSLYICWKND